MGQGNLRAVIDELSASEIVFTTALAERFGVSRSTLSKACASGRLERIASGAYRSAAVPPSEYDEISAAWKLTSPDRAGFERIAPSSWDGVAIGGTTAAAVNGIGDFHLAPIVLYTPSRFNTRRAGIRSVKRAIERCEVDFSAGFPVTTMERTLVDLVLDGVDPSLIEDALDDALEKGADLEVLSGYLSKLPPACKPRAELSFRKVLL